MLDCIYRHLIFPVICFICSLGQMPSEYLLSLGVRRLHFTFKSSTLEPLNHNKTKIGWHFLQVIPFKIVEKY